MAKLNCGCAPHYNTGGRTRDIMISRLAALLLLLLPPLIIYGFRVLFMALLGVAGAAGAEALWCLIGKKEQTVGDLSAVCTGLICVLVLPASVPLWLAPLISAFAVLCAKLPFGRLGRGPFSPALAGYAFAAAAFTEYFAVYPPIFGEESTALPLFAAPSLGEAAFGNLSPVDLLLSGKDPNLNGAELFLAQMRGPLGTTAVLLILAGAVWLFFRRSIAWQASVSFCCTVLVFSLFFRYEAVGLMSPVYDLFCGSMLFTAVFFAGDLVTAPQFASARVLYGALGGLLALLLRRFGALPGGELFALFIMNAVSASIDRLVWNCRTRGISFSETKKRISSRVSAKFKANNEEDEVYGSKI